MSGYATAQRAYTESSVMTAPPERLVLMLYEGAIRFLNQGSVAMRNGQLAQSRDRLRRAEAIIDELNTSLDMSQGEVAQRLRAIYIFCRRHLLQASFQRDPDAIEDVVRLLGELRESWAAVAVRATAAA